jgi:Transposase DDE domain
MLKTGQRPSPRFLEPVAKPWLDWRKIHIGIGEKAPEIRAVEFTARCIGAAPMLPAPLDQIRPGQKTASVTADGAFGTFKGHGAVATRGAAPTIPLRKNAKPWKPDTAGATARNEILLTSKRVGPTIWRR